MKKLKIFLASVLGSFLFVGSAFAQAAGDNNFTFNKYGVLALAFCMSFAAVGVAYSQSRVASTALEGIARNPEAGSKVQTPMIIALAMMEFFVILSFVISFQLLGKIN